MASTDRQYAIDDVVDALRKWRIPSLLGSQGIRHRYMRSRLGAFWLTISMAVLVAALGLVFGTIFRTPLADFLPFLSLGLIFWTYGSTMLVEGCNAFVQHEAIMREVALPRFSHVLTVWWRNTITLAHNIVIFPALLLIFLIPPGWGMLLFIPGFVLVSLNMLWMALVLAILCARFRDLTQIVNSVVQVMFYVTPIIWKPELLPARQASMVLGWNPAYHLISVVRSPLLGQPVSTLSWTVCGVGAVLGWVFALWILGRHGRRVPYWL